MNQGTWVEINSKNLAYNWDIIKSISNKIIVVVKGNAYGFGMETICKFAELGANLFAVANLQEASRLRSGGLAGDILILQQPEINYDPDLYRDFVITVKDLAELLNINKLALKANTTQRIHLYIDTGFSGSTITQPYLKSLVDELLHSRGVRLEGIFTHLIDADSKDTEKSIKQIELFDDLVNKHFSEMENLTIHLAASSGLFIIPTSKVANCVRIGSFIFGLQSSTEKQYHQKSLPVLEWKASVNSVINIKTGDGYGYGWEWIANRPSRLALLPVGYADGLKKAGYAYKKVLISKTEVDIVQVSMNATAIDISEHPEVKVGDVAVIIGKIDNLCITPEQIAERLQTAPEEITCSISPFIPRYII